MLENRTYRIDYNTAFKKALNSAERCFNVERYDINDGNIKCNTIASIWSWGETIMIQVKSINSEETKITVDSSPNAQLIDWGKSKENIVIFFNIFESE
jgi:hypothetical protein